MMKGSKMNCRIKISSVVTVIVAVLLSTPTSRPVIADYNTYNSMFALAKYDSNGSLITIFGDEGKVLTDFASSIDEVAYAMAIDANGKIVVAGYAGVDGYKFALARYKWDGSLDTTFGGDGKVITDFASTKHEAATAIAVDAYGKIIAAGGTSLSWKNPLLY